MQTNDSNNALADCFMLTTSLMRNELGHEKISHNSIGLSSTCLTTNTPIRTVANEGENDVANIETSDLASDSINLSGVFDSYV